MLRKIFGTARLLSLALMLAAFASRGAFAQTPEGTIITNTATVSFTDANTNTYSSVNASVNVTVGFTAGVSVTGSATATPASPSTGNVLSFPIQNVGNGQDQFQIPSDPSISVGGVVTITGYVYNSTDYATRALLNTALASVNVARNASITVAVKYDVASSTGGIATVLTLTAASNRTPATTDNQATTITPGQVYGVAVSPDGSQSITRLPSNGTDYSITFTVTNTGNGVDGYNLVASHPNAAITIVSVNGVAGSSTSISGVAAGAAPSIAVVYSVGDVAAGSTDNVVLTATSVGDNDESDAGYGDVTVIRPALAMAKAAYRDNQSDLLGGGDVVLPLEYIQYRVTVTNNGAAAASAVQITDAMPSEVTYQSASGDLAGWTFGFSGGTLTADLSGTLAPGASRFIWIRVRIN